MKTKLDNKQPWKYLLKDGYQMIENVKDLEEDIRILTNL